MAEVAAPTQPDSAPSDAPSLEEIAAAFPDLEVVAVIGRGGMGIVFKVRQHRLERYAALKILPPHLAAQPDFAQRFVREARALARLSHPNIVGVYDFGEAGGFYYLLMEYIDGVNLREALRAGRFSPEQAFAVVPKLCEALQYAHDEGVLHRDIKPENILLDSKGRVKLADFGIAKLAGDAAPATSITGTGASLGTPAYMAPEQIERPATVDHRADIYSLGVVFYEMLTGELPLGRFAPPSRKTTLDTRIDEIVLRALEKERELRQQSATEMRTQVEDVAAHPGTPSGLPRREPVDAPAASKRWSLRKTCAFIALFSLPIAGLITMLTVPAVQKAGANIAFGFLPFLIIPAIAFGVAAILGVSFRFLIRRGAPVWLAVLVCCFVSLLLAGGGFVLLLGSYFFTYAQGGHATADGNSFARPEWHFADLRSQPFDVYANEVARLAATEDPGDRVTAIDFDAPAGCVVEGSFFIERGDVLKEMPSLTFAIHSDPDWGSWRARLKVTAESLKDPVTFTRAVIGLQSKGTRGSEASEAATWPRPTKWLPVREQRKMTVSPGKPVTWELFHGESTGWADGEPSNPGPSTLCVRLQVYPIPITAPQPRATFSIENQRWWERLSMPQPADQVKSTAIVYVDEAGNTSIEGQPVPADKLAKRLQKIGLSSDAKILIHFHPQSPRDSVAAVVKLLGSGGYAATTVEVLRSGGDDAISAPSNPQPAAEPVEKAVSPSRP